MPDLENILAIPLIWTPNQDSQEGEHEVGQLVDRALATRDFLSGRLDVDQFCDVINDQGYDVESYLVQVVERIDG